MRVTPAQALPLMLLLVCMFGCKGAGQVLRVASSAAFPTAYAVGKAAAARSLEHAVEDPTTAERLEAQRHAEQIAPSSSGGPTELFVEMSPRPPPGTAPLHAAERGGDVLIEDAEGHWHRHAPAAKPATEER